MNPNEKLSEHFTLAELTYTEVRLPNNPPVMYIPKLKALCDHILEPVRARFGRPVRVNSGFRCDAVNTRVGGSPKSQHRKAEAVDHEIDGVSNRELFRWIVDNLDFDQVILEFVGHLDSANEWHDDVEGNQGWVHCSYVADRPNRKSIKVARRVRGEDGRIKTQYQTMTAEEVRAWQ